jgi:hypothetical protein
MAGQPAQATSLPSSSSFGCLRPPTPRPARALGDAVAIAVVPSFALGDGPAPADAEDPPQGDVPADAEDPPQEEQDQGKPMPKDNIDGREAHPIEGTTLNPGLGFRVQGLGFGV